MISLGFPLALIGLLSLPVFWWLLSALPPEPVRKLFPPLKLLRGLDTEAAVPQSIPLWLKLLRLLMVAFFILAIARPTLNPPSEETPSTSPLLLIMDDGWAAAPSWVQRKQTVQALLSTAALDHRSAALVFTSDGARADTPIALTDPLALRKSLDARIPRGFAPDRTKLAEWLQRSVAKGTLPKERETVWIASNADNGTATPFIAQLQSASDVTVMGLDAPAPVLLEGVNTAPGGLSVQLHRLSDKVPWSGSVIARGQDGQIIFRQDAAMPAGEMETSVTVKMPLELRNRVRSIALDGSRSAASVHLLDNRWVRPRVGLLGAVDANRDQPLLSQRFYLQKALAEVAEVQDLDPNSLPRDLPPIIVLLDSGLTSPLVQARLIAFVDNGGLLIRFAGPRLAARSDNLLPVPLRQGGRLLGSSMGWETPQQLAPFPESSPFYGLDNKIQANVRQQVLAQAGPGLSDHVWASLADGTPLVTSARMEKGRIVLFHVSAAPDASDLPLSGLFVNMLKRLLPLANSSDVRSAQELPTGLELQQQENGFGQLQAPIGDTGVLTTDAATQPPSAQFPAGIWARDGVSRVRNALDNVTITPLPALPGTFHIKGMNEKPPVPLSPWIFVLLLLLVALDSLAILHLGGKLRWPTGKAMAALLAGAITLPLVLAAPHARAQEPKSPYDMLTTTRLAYVMTGDAQTDVMSEAGLRGVTQVLNARTTVEPGPPAAINLERDDLHVVSFLYWPVTREIKLSDTAIAKLNNYLKDGGMLVLDTQDGGLRAAASGTDPALRSLFTQLDLPLLEPLPPNHVLTRTYYLLQDFPGRYAGGKVWVEADRTGSSLDGVSSIIVGSADWAAAWAVDAQGRPLAGVSNEIDNQRELARRFGVNLVMYALAGNYKADQVHVPALLERLGHE